MTNTSTDAGAPTPNADGNTLADGNATKTAGPPPSSHFEAAKDEPVDLDLPLEPQLERQRGERAGREWIEGVMAENERADREPAPVEPPRSWSAEDKALFKTWPRETQERIAEREAGREREFRRGQDAIARAKKEAGARGGDGPDAIKIAMHALVPELTAYGEGTPQEIFDRLRQESPEAAAEFAEKYRKFDALYSHAVLEHRSRMLDAGRGQEVLEQMVGDLKAAFPEVKNIADAQKLARDDPQRYAQWTGAMQQLNAAQSHVAAVESQRQEAATAQFREWTDAEDAKFQAAIPEYNDPERYEALQDASLDALIEDYGFDERELAQAWNTNPLLRDHRVQKMFADLGRLRLGRQRAAEARPKMPPKPQSAGVVRERSDDGGSLEAIAKRGDMKAYIEARRQGRIR
jgi:hypothetical protein